MGELQGHIAKGMDLQREVIMAIFMNDLPPMTLSLLVIVAVSQVLIRKIIIFLSQPSRVDLSCYNPYLV